MGNIKTNKKTVVKAVVRAFKNFLHDGLYFNKI